MWGWGFANTTDPEDVTIGHEIEGFIELVSSFTSSACYFHNLKFDGYFITYWLLTHGYSHVSGKAQREGTFSTLIGGMGQFYSVTVKWMNGNKTEFRDSLKKLPMTVARIAKSFGFGEGKGDIDYHAPRPRGYRMSEQERDYVRRDVSIVAKAIKQVHDNKMSGLTIAGDSLSTYKRMFGTKFRDVFPVLSPAMDAEIRRAYRGGYTYADSRHRGKHVGAGIVLDVNSLYPHVMRHMAMPYGVPVFTDGGPDNLDDLSVFAVTFEAKLKPDHLPCIQIKNSGAFTAAQYLTEITEPTELVVTNIDWKLYQDHYDIEVIEWSGTWSFQSAYGFFDEYIDHWMKIKKVAQFGIREIAKLHLNALYGKFASNPIKDGKYPTLKDGVVRLEEQAPEIGEPVYTPAGVFITSYARDLTIRAGQLNYDRFLYADTDSLHLLRGTPTIPFVFEMPKGVELDQHKLGAWKFEYEFVRGLYVRPKAYMEQHADGTYTNRVAGLPLKVSKSLTFKDVYDGAIYQGKLRPSSVPGGVVLIPVPYKMKF